MADIVTPEKRSLMMSGIRGKNTKPEILIRKALFARGWRYRLHDKRLPGKPDLVFPRLRAVVFVDGCFWHGHTCHLFRLPSSRVDFWTEKIARNRQRDVEVRKALDGLGWRHLTVWECALKGRTRLPIVEVIDKVANWLESGRFAADIEGTTDGDQ
ncbi:very short patch repair endonuclease [Mycoplana rhizolycopersici]|uniref:DNA mismatch endonuclease Vsr n=1 Tax=Mycoplana rhizolycopersici TaxID=2746702 RepID=A0ABX2QAI5_9HYPH|nr:MULTISPECIES: very short patch repair endonuclease [Rhizobium/Agrobacterium group]NVP54747.1 DNA mismatch endonuclease Vsr [Rhizobium rhizolycopersici]TQN60089.1 DNA mismatch endonuclease Vsr [Agrobacterium tumefaciens]